MLHPALYKLIWLQVRAALRRMTRGGATPGRVAAFLLGAVIVSTWLFSALILTRHHTEPQRVRTVMPLALLGICVLTAVTSVGDKAIAFTPGEVDQLFPGPFTRRQLLAYKLLKSTLMALLTACVLCVVMRKHASSWWASYVGVFFSLLFVQFFSIVLLLGGQAIGNAAYSRVRRAVLLVAVIVLLAVSRNWMSAGLHGGELAIARFHASPAGQILLSPFEPFGQLLTAGSTGDGLKWAVQAAALDGGLLLCIFLLDAYYLETAVAASERRYQKIQRVRKGSFLSLGVSKKAQWQLPRLPWMGGAGPIAWRQLTNAARSSRGLLLLVLIVAIGAAPVLSMAGREGASLTLFGGVVGWLTFLCSSMLNFDFRGDIDQIENLKCLPLRGWAVVVGQLVAPVLVLSAFHGLLLIIGASTLSAFRPILLGALIVVLPFNLILFEAENLIFLLFPSRPAAVSPGDFQVLGRKFIFVVGKILILGPACFFAALAGMLALVLTGKNVAAAAITAAIILMVQGAAMVPLLTWSFRRYDPSVHTPA